MATHLGDLPELVAHPFLSVTRGTEMPGKTSAIRLPAEAYEQQKKLHLPVSAAAGITGEDGRRTASAKDKVTASYADANAPQDDCGEGFQCNMKDDEDELERQVLELPVLLSITKPLVVFQGDIIYDKRRLQKWTKDLLQEEKELQATIQSKRGEPSLSGHREILKRNPYQHQMWCWARCPQHPFQFPRTDEGGAAFDFFVEIHESVRRLSLSLGATTTS